MQRLIYILILFFTSHGVLFAQADHMLVTSQPAETIAGQTVAGNVAVTVYDVASSPVGAGIDVTVALSKNAFAGASTTTVSTNASGVASFSNISIETADTDYQLTFSSTSIPDITSNNFDVVPAAPSSMSVTTQPAETSAGVAIQGSPAVTLTDAFGNTIQGIDITVTESGAYIFDAGTTTIATNASGVAEFSDIVINTAATYQLVFDADDTNASAVADVSSNNFDVVPAAPSSMSVTTQPAETSAGVAIQGSPAVTLTDAFGNTIQGIDITVTEFGAYIFDAGTTTIATNASGVAEFSDIVINTAATYQLGFDADDTNASAVADVSSNNFDVVPAAPSSMSVTTQPAETSAGVAIQGSPAVTLTDAFGNTIQGIDITVTESGAYIFDAGTTTIATNASGVAEFSDIVINTAATYQLVFDADDTNASAVADVSSNNFDVVPAAPSSMSVTTQPKDTIQNYPIPGTPTVLLTDAYGNAISGIEVTTSTNKNSFIGASTTAVTTNAQGLAAFSNLIIDIADTDYTIAFSADNTDAPAVADITSNAFQVYVEQGTITITNQPQNTVATNPLEGADIINGPAILVENMSGTPLNGISVGVILPGTNDFDPASTITATTNVNGIAIFDNLIIDDLGTNYQLRFYAVASNTVAPVFSNSFDIIASTATLSVDTEPVESIVNYAVSGSPTVYLENGGSPVQGVDVTAHINQNAFKVGSTITVTTNAQGKAVFDNLIIEDIATDYQITFKPDQAGVAIAHSTQFDVVEELAVLTVQQNPQLTIAGETINGPPSVQIINKSTGNPPVSPVNIYATINKSTFNGGSTTMVSATSGNNGIATFTNLIIDDADTDYAITFSAQTSGIADVSTSPFEVLAVAGNMTVTTQPAESIEGYSLVGPPTVTILDLAAQPVQGIQVDLILNQNGFASGTTTLITDVNGEAVFNDLIINTIDTDYSLFFDVDINTGIVSKTSDNFDVVEEAFILAMDEQPTLTIAGEKINGTPAVRITDAQTGDPVNNATISATLNKASFNGSSTLTAQSNAAGIATFDNLIIDADDTGYELIFSTGTSGVADIRSTSFDVIPVQGTITIDQQPLETVDGYTIEGAPAITILETDGVTPMAGIAVTAVLNKNDFTPGSTITLITDAGGQAIFDNLTATVAADDYKISFNTSINEGIPILSTNLFDVVAEVAIIAVETQPQLTIAGEIINGVPTISLKTPGGIPIQGGNIYVSTNKGILAGTTNKTTDDQGEAVFDDLIINAADTDYQLIFSSGASGIAPQNSANFDIVEPLGILTISQQPLETVNGEFIDGPPTVTITETDASPWTGSEVDVTVSLNKNGFTSGTLTKTTSGGVAVFDDLLVNTIDNGYQLQFDINIAEQIAGKTSALFDVMAVTGHLAVTLQPTETVAGDPINGPPTVQLTNLLGNPVSGVTVTASLNKLGFNGASATSLLTNANGEAVFTNLIIDDFDTDYQITFKADGASGVAKVVSDAFEVTDATLNMAVTTEPTSSTAGTAINGTPTVTITDGGGGVAGVSVTASINKNSFTGASTLTATTNASGVAIFSNLVLNTSESDYQITFNADFSGVPNAHSAVFDVSPAAAHQITVTSEPTVSVAGQVINGNPTGTVRDEFGNPVAGVDVTVEPNQHSIVSGTLTVNSNASGVATFTDLVINTAASNYQLFFKSPGVITGNSAFFAVQNAPADEIIILIEPSETVAGAAIEGPPSIIVKDEFGNSVQGEDVTVSEVGGYAIDDGTLTQTTPENGEIEFSNLVINTEGANYQLRFSINGIEAISAPFNIVPGNIFTRFNGGSHSGFVTTETNDIPLGQTPVRIEVMAHPQESVVGDIVKGLPQIVVYDAIDRQIPNVSVTVSGVVFAGGTTTAQTNANGEITFNDLIIDTKGTYSFTFTADDYPAVTAISNSFDVIDAQATLSIHTEPQTTIAGEPIAGHPVALLTNSIGMPISGIDITVFLNQYGFDGGTTTVTTDANGQAIFDDLSITNAATGFQLIFDADYTGVPNITSAQFSVTNAAADYISVTSQPQETEEGAAIQGPPEATVYDQFGNTVSGIDVDVTEVVSGVIDAGITSLTSNAQGVTSFATLVINNRGTYQLAFSSPGLATVTSNSFSVISGTVANRFKGNTHSGFGNLETIDKALGQTPVRIEVVTQPQETVAGFSIEGPPTIRVYDAIDNPVFGVQISADLVSGSFSGGIQTKSTNANGEIVFNDLKISVGGTYTMVFSADNHSGTVSDVNSNSFDVVSQVYTMQIDAEPINTIAGQTISGDPAVSIKNTINQPLVGVDVTVFINQNDFSAGTQTVTTDAAGQAIFSDLVINKAAESYQLIFDADYSGITNHTSAAFDVTHANASQFAIVTQPSSTLEGAAIEGPPSISLSDNFGNPIPNASITISETSGYAFDAGTENLVTTTSGQVAFDNIVINTTGNYQLTFSTPGLADITSVEFSVASGTVANRFKGNTHSGFSQQETTDKALGQIPTRIEVLTQPQETVTGLPVEGAPAIVVYDEVDNPIGNLDVTVSIPGGFTLGSTTGATTDAQGEITYSDLIKNDIGTYQLTFVLDDYPAITAVSQSFNIVNQELFLAVTEQPQQTIAGQLVEGPPTVQIANSLGQGFAGVDVTVMLNQYSFSSAVGTQTATTDAAGFAIFDQLTIDEVASGYQLIFDADYTGVLNVTSGTFDVVNSTPDHLTLITQPDDTEAGASILGYPAVRVEDEFGNTISGITVNVALTGGGSFDGGTFSAVSNSDGVVAFNDLVLNNTGEYSLTFSSAGVPDIFSAAFNIISGTISYRYTGSTHSGFANTSTTDKLLGQTPTRLEITAQPQESIAGSMVAGSPTVVLYDEVDNPIAGINIQVNVDGFFNGASTTEVTTGANGAATFNNLIIDDIGTYKFTFTAPGYGAVSNVLSQPFDVVNQMLSVSATIEPSETVAGQSVQGFPTIKLQNEFGQGFEGVDVTATINQHTFAAASTVIVTTNGSGLAVFDNLILETAADNYEIIYDIDYTGVSNQNSAAFNVVPAPASQMAITTQPADGLAESAIEGPPTVILYDDYNNAIEGVDITVTEAGGYPIDNGTMTITTDTDGIASFTDLVINTAGEYTLNFSADAAGVPDVQSTTFQILPGNIADRFTGGSHSGFSTQEEPDVLLKQTPVGIAFITQPQQSVTNLPVQGPPFLQVVDLNGRPVPLTAVTASIVGGSPALSGTITLETNSNGEVLFNNISIPQTGTYLLRFQVIGYPTVFAVSQEFEVTTQTLAINITQQPQNSVAGEIIGGFPSVQITNSLSQPGPEGVEVTVIVNQNELASDPAQHTVLTNASGEALFNQLIINAAAENYQLIFEVDYAGINSISTDNFIVSPAAPDHLSVEIQPGDSETGAAIAGPPTAALYDVYNNPISGVDVTVTENGGELLGGTASLATNENGMAAFSNLTIASAGLYQLVFDADAIGVTNELSTSFNIISAETAHRFKGGTHSGFIQSEIIDQLLSEPPSVEDPIFTDGEANLCQGSTNIQYTATAANSESIAYSLSIASAGTINATTGVLDLAAGFTGAFNVIATAEGYNGPTSETFAVTVDANIDAPAFTDPVIVVCEGATETYVASSVNTTVIAYSVAPPEAGAIDASTGAMVWNAGFNGASFISATAGEVGDCGGQQTTTIEVTVNPEIDAPTFTQGAVELCQDAPNEIYTAIAANADDVLYSASPVEAFVTINTNTGEIDWAADFSGTATITARATGLCGGPKDTDREVIIRPTPNTGVISGAQDVACNGSGITYSVPLTAGSSYAWTVPAEATIISGENGPDNNEITVDFGETSGFIRVVETSQFGCSGNQQELQITLHGCNLAANFEADQTESCEGSTVRFTNLSTGDIDTWEWDFGAGATPQTATGIGPHDVVYDNAGQYTVSLTVHEQMVEDTHTETNYITINSIGTWLGTVSSNWFDGANWSCGVIPNLSATAFDVTVSATATYNPQISGAGARVKNITIENGAALTIATGTNLTVTGNWINNGTFGGDNGTIIFRGDNCTVSGTATTTFENVQVYENKQLIGHLGSMNINGNFIIDGLYTHNNGAISFTGTEAQQISGSAAQVIFHDIIINKSTENLTLNRSIALAGNLTLTDGIVFTDAANLLTIQHGGSASEGSDNSFVDGPIEKIGNAAFTFPTGDGPVWAPIAIAAPTAVSDAFRAEYYFEANEHTTRPCTNCESGIEYVSAVEFWDLSRTAGSATPDVTMYFKNMVRSGISDLGDLVYAHWNGAQWVNMGETAFDDGANACYITGTGFVNYSPHAPASKLGSNPLPIELLSFTAKPLNNQIKLEWTTLAEINNDYFTIEKTLDGVTFDFVTQLSGAGNSATPLAYSTLDANPYTGTSYYRLTQTDFDGTKVSFPLEEVYFEQEMAEPALVIFPNPASADNATIEISNVANQELSISVYSETGGQLYTSEIRADQTSNNIVITQSDIETQLKPGVYLIRVTGKNISLQKKMIIL